MKITVIDKRCGDGKSQGMVEYIKKRATNTAFGEKFLYITPYLEQCHSIAGTKPIEEGVDDSPKYDKTGSYLLRNPSIPILVIPYFSWEKLLVIKFLIIIIKLRKIYYS